MKAIYPGTFDPITLGHIDIINRASKMFDKIIVAVAEDNSKNTLFSVDQRVRMAKSSLKHQEKVKVVSFSGLLVNFAQQNNSRIIIRGLRAASDFEYEFQMSAMNSKLNDEVQTIFLPAAENMHFIASRLVKEVAYLGGDIKKFVTKDVEIEILEKIKNKC
jgi:pantetheine-phosphate adenylyltransferase